MTTTWTSLKADCIACRKCSLYEGRTNLVFGVGDESAEVMFVGEGPGEREDQLGEPFVGRAGQLLDDMLAAIGLDRSKVYIANIVKCRPPGNRDPLNVEQEACIGWLRAQVQLIDPKIIVCLGRIAASVIIEKDFKITRDRGKLYDRGKYALMGIYHPAFVLRDPGRRPEVFEDLKKLEDYIKSHCISTVCE